MKVLEKDEPCGVFMNGDGPRIFYPPPDQWREMQDLMFATSAVNSRLQTVSGEFHEICRPSRVGSRVGLKI